jgi:hypothetical protein
MSLGYHEASNAPNAPDPHEDRPNALGIAELQVQLRPNSMDGLQAFEPVSLALRA